MSGYVIIADGHLHRIVMSFQPVEEAVAYIKKWLDLDDERAADARYHLSMDKEWFSDSVAVYVGPVVGH